MNCTGNRRMVRAVSDNRANLPASKLRWYQFKLGTLLVFTTGVALVLGVALSSPYMTIIVPFLAGSIAGVTGRIKTSHSGAKCGSRGMC